MEDKQKIKALWLVIVSLIVLNISVLGWLWFSHPKGHFPPGGRVPIAEIVDFSTTQRQEFEKLKDVHLEEVEPIRDTIQVLKRSLFDYLKQGKIDTAYVAQQENLLAAKIRENEYKTLLHLAQVRAMCTQEQKERFDTKVLEQFKHQGGGGMGGGHMPPPPPRRD
jgi:protein CpxP